METKTVSLLAKYKINFDIVCKSGLHIGGTDTGAGIGEIDNPVLKDSVKDYPYICGSSLKGRMRERLEWLLGNVHVQVEDIKNDREKIEEETKKELGKNFSPEEVVKNVEKKIRNRILSVGQCNCGQCEICHYFGHSSQEFEDEAVILGPTRFIFRDAFPKENTLRMWEEKLGPGIYTEIKTENTISRLTAIANPRNLERVPAGSVFSGEIIIELYETPSPKKDDVKEAFTLIFQGMMAIEQSFLGGTGSRGSGTVEFKNLTITKITSSYYKDPKIQPEIISGIELAFNATQHWQENTIAKIN